MGAREAVTHTAAAEKLESRVSLRAVDVPQLVPHEAIEARRRRLKVPGSGLEIEPSARAHEPW